MTDIEQRVEDEANAKLRLHSLRRAHERLADIRADLKNTTLLLEDDEQLVEDITATINNSIEPLMWKIETAIREGK